MRAQLEALADEAARDPSRAAVIARHIADLIRSEEARGDRSLPYGYIYQGAYQWLAQVDELEPEPLPTPETPKAAPIDSTQNEGVEIRIPFDCLIMGVAGWAQPITRLAQFNNDIRINAAVGVGFHDGRGLFTCDWELDGRTSFTTTGNRQLMVPAAVTVGTRLRPRPLAWTLRRNQVISVRFRNLMNVWIGRIENNPDEYTPPNIAAAVAFYALNLEAP